MNGVGALITVGLGSSLKEFMLTGLGPGDQLARGAGDVDPRVWWDWYYRRVGSQAPAAAIPTVAGVAYVVGVEAIAELGDVVVAVRAAVRGNSARGHVGHVVAIIDPFVLGRRDDEWILEHEQVTP